MGKYYFSGFFWQNGYKSLFTRLLKRKVIFFGCIYVVSLFFEAPVTGSIDF